MSEWVWIVLNISCNQWVLNFEIHECQEFFVCLVLFFIFSGLNLQRAVFNIKLKNRLPPFDLNRQIHLLENIVLTGIKRRKLMRIDKSFIYKYINFKIFMCALHAWCISLTIYVLSFLDWLSTYFYWFFFFSLLLLSLTTQYTPSEMWNLVWLEY